MENRHGPSDDPCAIPVLTANVLDETPLYLTNDDLACRYELSQSMAFPVTPNVTCRALRHIRRYVTRDIARTIACSIIGSRIDYCNALLYGANKDSLAKLQRVQNNAARVVCNTRRGQQESAELLRELHFLPVASRINFKVALLCFKAFKLGQPSYLNSLLASYTPARNLRSSNQDLLATNTDKHTLKLAHSRFSIAAPAVWNDLPLTVRSADTVDAFKSRLKTHLFRTAV